MAAVPGSAYAVADFPFLLGFGDLDDGADEFVAEAFDLAVDDERLVHCHCSGGERRLTVDPYLRGRRERHCGRHRMRAP